MKPGHLILLVIVLSLYAMAFWLAVRWTLGRSAGRAEGVAAPSPAPAGRLADVIEEMGALSADMKSLKREWGDFDRSWQKRWGTVTRGARRDVAASAEAAAEADADPDSLSLFAGAAPAATAPASGRPLARRLVPLHRLGRGS